ncbi:class I SAM-dependent methyltransferase [Nostoc sp. CHAB 5784]|uniref:class I SAM-dependent methyltransferase n=1 Tax=Nostoc mirabile TaxID=2907820 RepID=UPI001E2B8DCA|nr:class I SAM-dependent methyltransferase [Nostoc mirabile]MCC5662862.1 class I SAM-dependent methyltransferase [Nostoc mirabile CHAB5784]
MSITRSFKGTAWYYARYRPGYPEFFFADVIEKFQLDGAGRLLDLGCGTGQLMFPLARHFQEVVAIDQEPEMLAEAQIQAKIANVNNVIWFEISSEKLNDLKAELGEFKLVTMGRSFHWMDRDPTLQTLDEIITPTGGIVIVGDGSIWTRLSDVSSNKVDWHKQVKAVVQRWLGEARRAGDSIYVEPQEKHEIVLARSPFSRVEVYNYEFERQWNIETIKGHLYSTSFCSLPLLGERVAAFEKDLENTLLAIEPSGKFQESILLEALIAWRK